MRICKAQDTSTGYAETCRLGSVTTCKQEGQESSCWGGGVDTQGTRIPHRGLTGTRKQGVAANTVPSLTHTSATEHKFTAGNDPQHTLPAL